MAKRKTDLKSVLIATGLVLSFSTVILLVGLVLIHANTRGTTKPVDSNNVKDIVGSYHAGPLPYRK